MLKQVIGVKRIAIASFLAMFLVVSGCDDPENGPASSGEISYQVIDVVEGSGALAEKGKLLKMEFAMWLIPEGEGDPAQRWEGDTTYTKYQVVNSRNSPGVTPPSLFDTNSLFPGLYQGMEGMREGGIRIIVCPPEMAFAEHGNENVPPNTPIKMEVELTSVDSIRDAVPVDWSRANRDDNGLQWVILDEGSGNPVKKGHGVEFNIIAKVVDNGETFDNTYVTGTPQRMIVGDQVGHLIPGLKDAFFKLNVGGRGRFLLPPNLGFGNNPPNDFFPENATLEFEIEVLTMSEEVINIPTDNAM